MSMLILGLVIFLGMHSVRIFVPDWREKQVARLGVLPWKSLYATVSIIGFVVLIWGFGLARQHPALLYIPPMWLRHLNALFTLVAFVLLAAAYVPRNRIKARLGHPMLLAVKVWALGHLLATGMLRDVVLFGALLAWAIALFAVLRRRDRLTGTTYPAGTLRGDVTTVLIGVVVWAIFAFWLHQALIGVNPMA
ncbi:MAG: NnrU family protein [Rhodanobacter sp.]|nr:MAG: NnrU family protein [Rhodanobacter sp.]